MTTPPAAGYISNAGRTEGEQKTAFEDFLAATKQLLGGQSETILTIAAGSITPTAATHAVDTEAEAATDDLSTITQTEHDDGRLLLLHIVTASRVVVVKHAAGGTGQISLASGQDRTLRRTAEWLLLKRTGALWEEILTAGTGVPTGSIQLWSTGTPPPEWLLCDGAAVSRSTYAALFALLGTTYGIGDGSTTFNLPNLKGRVPMGFDAAQTEFNAIGKMGGAKTHVLTTGEMPSHAHGTNGASHQHGIPAGTGTGGQQSFVFGTATTTGTFHTDTAVTGLTVTAAGSGAAHNNLSPYLALPYIIRI